MKTSYNLLQNKKRVQQTLALITLLLFFIGDLAKFISKTFDLGFQEYPKISKLIVFVLIALYMLWYKVYKTSHARPLILILILFVFTYLINNLSLKNSDFFSNISSNLDYFIKACVLPFMLIPFFTINEVVIKKCLKLILLLFWINAISIIIGYLLNIETLETYYKASRFGHKGIYNRSTYVSYLFIFVIIYYYYNWRKQLKTKTLLILLLASLISLQVGTKRIYIFLGCLFIFHFINAKLYKKYYVWGVLLLFSFIIVRYYDTITSFFSAKFDVLVKVYDNHGFISALTSYRSDLLIDYYNVYIFNNWSFLNYFLGGAFFHKIRPEMDFIDLYLLLGLVGIIAYLYIFYKYIFNFKTKNKILLFAFVMIILLAFTSSGIIISGNFAILLIVFRSYYYIENKNTK